MRSGGGSAVGAGCGAFGLVGLLIGVGLTVYLGSRALDSTSVVGGRPHGVAGAIVAISPTSAPDGGAVTVTSDDFGAGAALMITTCLGRTGERAWRCDPTTSVAATVDPLGHLELAYPVRRTATISAEPVDCADRANVCVVRVRQREPVERVGAARLTVVPSEGPTTNSTGGPGG